MALGERIHIYLTDKCNGDCPGCFREILPPKTESKLIEIANILAENKNKVKNVVLGGGEPLIVADLDNILQIFHDAKISVDLHTNCLALNYGRMKQLKGLVDVIGVPIDSLDEKVQSKLRRQPNYVNLIKNVVTDIAKFDFKIEYHTVATCLNIDELPRLYNKFIGKTNFKRWNIYLFNEDLARNTFFQKLKYNMLPAKNMLLKSIELLEGPASDEKGHSDCILARFLLMEEKMKKKHKDGRINFIDLYSIEDREPYCLINKRGDMLFCAYFSQKRTKIANILEDGFEKTMQKLQKAYDLDSDFDEEDFINAERSLPLFARLHSGGYVSEEIEAVKPKYRRTVVRLAKLWEKSHPQQIISR